MTNQTMVGVNDGRNATAANQTTIIADTTKIKHATYTEGWNDGDTILIAATHDGRRAQKQIDIAVSANHFGENIGTLPLKAHWGCCG